MLAAVIPTHALEVVSSGGAALLAGALLAALLVGYLVWLGRERDSQGGASSPAPVVWPWIDVIVAVHDEAEWIRGKLQNLSELRYPEARLKIWIVDGASVDGTTEVASAWIRDDARFELLRLGVANKTAQLNAALARSRGEWIMVTDGDAQLGPDTLTTLVAAGEADAELAVVGTPVVPAGAHALERLHWKVANWLRQQESRRGFASNVAAPCYLFRRSLLALFPRDVVADDVHVAFTAGACGRRVGVVAAAVTELRSPTRLVELFRHKVRKADAYLREIFRFVPRLGAMRSPAGEVFLWRAAHMTVVPVLASATLIALAGWIASVGISAVGMILAAPAGAMLGTGVWLGWRSMPKLLQGLALALLLMVVLLAALAAYPFSRQTSCYPKIASRLEPTYIKAEP